MLGDRICGLRKSKNLTQKELAKILNVSNTTLSQYENGIRVPSDDIKIKIANYFNVTLDYLLSGKHSNENINESQLTKKDEKDIAKTMERMKKQLSEDQDLLFNGELLDAETAKLLLDAIEQQEKMIKIINKKYTPKKYRKD